MTLATGSLLSVNVGGVREFEYNGRPAKSAIWKSPIPGRVVAQGVNLAGDDQADRVVHGGPDKAIYAYAVEDQRWWESEIGRRLEYGEFGENLTAEGIDVTSALVGERWEIGSTVLEVSEPRVPCWRFGVRMDDKLFPRRFTEAGRPGAYLRIIVEGDVGAGDPIRVVSRPDHNLTIGDVFRIFTRDQREVGRLLASRKCRKAGKHGRRNVSRKRNALPPSPLHRVVVEPLPGTVRFSERFTARMNRAGMMLTRRSSAKRSATCRAPSEHQGSGGSNGNRHG